eukprot:TRINITY_DN1278_c0_g1_i2.p1 TRINITY_DN1278_c0_g1~~TRINITY_DN1278_c0_g1_i2.p1  ORF type:complete len:276 (+),score=59.36 TRINITY_DN1278_c0_g1_i2:759-1586(+)
MDGQDLDGRTIRVNQVRKQGPRFSRDGSFRDGRGGHGGGRGRSPPYRRGSPGGFGRGRRSPPYRGRSRSPRPDYSPQRYSPHGDRYGNHGSRSPYSSRSRSPEERPRRHEEAPNRRRDRTFDRATPRAADDAKTETKAADVERLRLEIEEKERQRAELQSKVQSLEASIEESSAAEISLKVKNEGLLDKLAVVKTAAVERAALLKKIQSAVLKVHAAEEHLRESEKELKALINVAVSEIDSTDVGGGEDHGVNHEDEDGKVDMKSKTRKALASSL